MGVAFTPDGARALVAVANLNPAAGRLLVFDPLTGNTQATATTGILPTAVAVSPDGLLVFVTNQADDAVSVHDAAAGFTPLAPVAVGLAPTGIAIAPDGTQVYVAHRDDASVGMFAAQAGAASTSVPLGAGSIPLALAIHPQGMTAVVADLGASPRVVELGGMRTLTVAPAGTGIGRVRSIGQPGIDCGTMCQAQYPLGSSVTLRAVADAASSFAHWGGDPGCGNAATPDLVVTLNGSISCVAVFNASAPAPAPSNVPKSGCFIATAAYGSPMASQVQALRRFRDEVLMPTEAGRRFVDWYYRHSPGVADFIREREPLRRVVRWALAPLVALVEWLQAPAADAGGG